MMQTRSAPVLWRRLPLALLLGVLLTFAAACSDDNSDEVADDIDTDSAASASPTSGGGVDEDVQEVEISIEDGQFSDDQVEFQQDSPSVLQVTNNDDVRYMLTIGDLVAESASIVPGDSSVVEFTTPADGEYEAELTSEDGGEVLDTMTVVVQAPGGVD